MCVYVDTVGAVAMPISAMAVFIVSARNVAANALSADWCCVWKCCVCCRCVSCNIYCKQSVLMQCMQMKRLLLTCVAVCVKMLHVDV